MGKSMKLSTKIAAGFAAIIAIMMALGGLAVKNMSSVKTESVKLADEYVPEVAVANDIERKSMMTMYAIRGYTMSLDKAYLEDGKKTLIEVNEDLKKAETLSQKALNLTALKGQVDKAKEAVAKYGTLLTETVDNNEEIAKIREGLNNSAANFASNSEKFSKAQSEILVQEVKAGSSTEKLQQRFDKVSLMNRVIELGSIIRINVWKTQALNDLKQLDDADAKFSEMYKVLTELRGITQHEEHLKQIEQVKVAAESYQADIKEFQKVMITQSTVNKNRGQAAESVLEAARTTSSKGIEHTSSIATNAASSLASGLWIIIVGLFIATGIGITLGFIITLSIAAPLKKAIDSMRNATEEIGAASTELSGASQQLSSGASEQASSIEETSASLEEMGGMVQNNVTNAQKAKDLAAQVRSVSEQGNASMGKLQTSMTEILESNEKIEQLVKVIGEIGEKTKVMDEIVFQTKLLSFNASVEAERAGEHGRGFAVVAQEVGILAQMSGKSAQEIAQIVTGSIRQAEAITTENKKKVETGNSYVLETSKYLKEIMVSAATVTDGAQQVLSASQEQAAGIKQINLAMSNLDKATQENSAMAEETASTSEELNAQTTNLNALVDELVQLVDGHVPPHVQHSRHPSSSHSNLSHQRTVKSVKGISGEPATGKTRTAGGGAKPKPLSLLKKVVGSDVTSDHDDENWDSL